MDANELLLEIEDILRTAPPAGGALNPSAPETLQWLGRIGALVDQLPIVDSVSVPMTAALSAMSRPNMNIEGHALTIKRLLYQLRWRFLQQTKGPTGLAVNAGMVFDYFDGITKVLKTARSDVLFVDPYLDDEFL